MLRTPTAVGGAVTFRLVRHVAGFAPAPSLLVIIARGPHLFPFRTEKLSPAAPMVLVFDW